MAEKEPAWEVKESTREGEKDKLVMVPTTTKRRFTYPRLVASVVILSALSSVMALVTVLTDNRTLGRRNIELSNDNDRLANEIRCVRQPGALVDQAIGDALVTQNESLAIVLEGLTASAINDEQTLASIIEDAQLKKIELERSGADLLLKISEREDAIADCERAFDESTGTTAP